MLIDDDGRESRSLFLSEVSIGRKQKKMQRVLLLQLDVTIGQLFTLMTTVSGTMVSLTSSMFRINDSASMQHSASSSSGLFGQAWDEQGQDEYARDEYARDEQAGDDQARDEQARDEQAREQGKSRCRLCMDELVNVSVPAGSSWIPTTPFDHHSLE
jgi:hypothetical protein